jgi:hypothetical protein
MIARLAIAACIIAAATLTAVATASPAGSKQRIVITTAEGNGYAFVLTPLSAGPLARDSGTAAACCWTERFIKRGGQSIEIDNPLKTYVGKHGTFTTRLVIEWVDAGHGQIIGTGTWTIVRGTGAYEHVKGNGRLAVLWPKALASWETSRAEGLVALRG